MLIEQIPIPDPLFGPCRDAPGVLFLGLAKGMMGIMSRLYFLLSVTTLGLRRPLLREIRGPTIYAVAKCRIIACS